MTNISPETITPELIEKTAFEAADKFFKETLGGVDRYACGFAWVNVYPENKGNTRLGKDERRVLEKLGFRKDYTGKAYILWNPAKYGCQNIDTLEVGARAAAELLTEAGFKAYAGSRLD